GLRPDDVTTDHVPAFEAFLARALRELSGAVGGPAAHGLRAQHEAAASVLRSFAAQGAVDLARGKWPSRRAADTNVEFVVTAADLSSLADVVDLPQEKDRIHRQIESIRQKLVLIAEGTE